jgi:hypothetical protein
MRDRDISSNILGCVTEIFRASYCILGCVKDIFWTEPPSARTGDVATAATVFISAIDDPPEEAGADALAVEVETGPAEDGDEDDEEEDDEDDDDDDDDEGVEADGECDAAADEWRDHRARSRSQTAAVSA